jgi:hypothetical protein
MGTDRMSAPAQSGIAAMTCSIDGVKLASSRAA